MGWEKLKEWQRRWSAGGGARNVVFCNGFVTVLQLGLGCVERLGGVGKSMVAGCAVFCNGFATFFDEWVKKSEV